MKRVLFLLLVLSLGGCATAELGAPYDPDTQELVDADAGRVVVYPDQAVDKTIWFLIDLNGEDLGRLFQDTFLSAYQEPGPARVRVREYWTGEGFGKDIAEVFTKPLAEPDSGLPPSLNAGIATFVTIDIKAGEITYLRLRKVATERFYECEDTKDTTTMCRREVFMSVLELVPAEEAEPELVGHQESL